MAGRFNVIITGGRPFHSAIHTIILAVVLTVLSAVSAGSAVNAPAVEPEVRVGSELEFPPYAFVDENGQAAGFSVDLIKAVADAMGLSIRISTGPWDTVWKDLVAGRIDVLPVVAKVSDRDQLVDFSLPHTETYDAFFVREDDRPIQDIAAAMGKEIVVMRSDAAHHALVARSFQGRLVLVDTIPEGLSLISAGKHDAFLCSKLIGAITITKHGITGLTAGPPIPDYKRVFSFAVKKGDAVLLEKLNQGLMIIKTNGVYERLYEKWLTVDDPWQKVKKYLLPAGGIMAAIALVGGFLLIVLQRMVVKRTRELSKANEELKKEVAERIRVEAEIRTLSLELEHRVAERTAQLEAVNSQLRNEINERVQAEKAITRLASFPRLNPNPVMETDSSGRITYFNPAIQRILEDLGLDRNDTHVFLPDDFDDILRQVEKKPASTFNREVIIRGRIFSATVHLVPEFNVVRIYAYDITERKRAEDALRRSKEDWEKTFNSVPDMIAILDSQHRIIRVNRAMADRLGLTPEQCAGKRCHEIIHGTLDVPSFCPLAQTFQDAGEHTTEVHEPRLDGHFLVTTIPMLNDQGQIIGGVHIARDITEQKKMEELLIQNESRLNRAQEIAHLGSWELDLISNRLYWSDEVYRIFGLEPQEFSATYKAFLEAVHPDDRAAVDAAYSSSLREGRDTYEIEHRIVRKSTGEVRIVHEKCEHTRDKSGRIIRSIGMVHDITEQKHSEEALRSAFARYRSFIAVTGQIGWTTNPEGEVVEDLTEWRNYTGQSFEDIKGWGWSKALHPDDLAYTADAWKKAVREKNKYEVEYRIRRHDGGYRYFMARGTPVLKEDGTIREWVGICIDITDRKDTEEQIKASLKEKELLLREIHHRVKNNMTVIFSMLKLQSRHVKDEHYRSMFHDSMSRIKSMALVHEKLYRSGNLAAVNFGAYLKDLANGLFTSYGISSGRVRLSTDVADIGLGIDTAIPCGLIVSELVSNAMKHAFSSDKTGEILVSLREITGSEIELIVSDNGSGMPGEIDISQSSSMGLNLVNALVKQLHGTIEVSGEKGTEFRVRFRR